MNFLSIFKRNKPPAKASRRGFEAGSIFAQIHDQSWVVEESDINEDIRLNNALIRKRARDHEKNNDFVRRYLNLLRTHVVGPRGITLQCAFKNKEGSLDTELNDHIEENFREWAEKGNCDVTGKLSYVDLQNLAITCLARDGEVLFLEHFGTNHNRFGYSLQMVDIDLFDETFDGVSASGNKIRSGIELDSYERPIAYYLETIDGKYSHSGKRFSRFEAERVIHIFRPERGASQLRGVSWLASSILSLRDLKGLMKAELISSRAAACKMGFYTREAVNGEYKGEDITKGFDRDQGELTKTATPASFELLPDGIKFQPVDFQHPNAAFSDFIKTSLRSVASGVGVSYNSLSNDLEGVSYSSLRSGLLDERDGYMVLQELLISSLVRRNYRSLLTAATLSSIIKIKPHEINNYRSPKFLGRRWSWVDPLKDTKAATEAINHGIRSRTDVAAEAGKSFEDVVSELAAEEALMDSYGLSIAKKEKIKINNEEENL